MDRVPHVRLELSRQFNRQPENAMRTNLLPRLFSYLAVVVSMLSLAIHAQLVDVTQPGDPIVPTSNNSPGSEAVANAIDNVPTTKYLNFDRLNTGFTVTPRVGLSVVQCLTLTSANDAPERDPTSFTLEGSYDGSNFVQIASNAVPAFTARFQKVVIRFENNTPYLAYRLIFPTVAGPGGNSMQIAEVELLGFLAPTDVTQPGDPIVPTSNNSPGSEAVANAIDNVSTTKYLNFDRLNTGFTVTPAVGATLISGITLTSANDAPERDPASYTLEGSLDGTSFFPISSGAVPAFPTRFYKNYIFFNNARAFRAYRLVFPTVVGPGGNSMQIAEVELLGDVADLAQDITLPGDPIVPSSNNSPGSEAVANAIDNVPTTKYLNFDRLNTGFTVNPGGRGLTVVSGLTLTSANDAPERDPASYTLSGSYDGTNFTQISAGAVGVFTTRFEKQTILFANNIPYLQYQILFPTVAGPGGNSMQIAEVEFLGVLADTDVTTPGDPIVPSSNNSPGSEAVANAIDNVPTTKYLNFDRLNTGFTVTPRVGGTTLSGLSFVSANDAPERDPATYVLTGSEDGSNFVAISSGNVPAFPTRFFKNYVFFPDNTKEFAAYQLIFPTVVGPGGNSMQIAEIEFLGHQRGGGSCTTETNGLLISRQPQDTPVLLGSTATFRVGLTGPWKVQWLRNGVAIPGANNASYTTPVATAGDDGALYVAKVGPATVGGVRGLCETSAEAMLNIFTPSTTECIGLSWRGSGANGAPTDVLPTDITGFSKQAFWNNLTGGGGTLANPLNSSNVANPTITVNWATSGEWGVGTGNSDPTARMFNGICTSFGTDEGSAATVTLSGVPAGNHSLFLYTVQVLQEFFNMDFIVVTHDSGGADVIQRRYIRPLNPDEYNPFPGFFLVPSQTPETRGVGSMMRFDNLQPGPDGIIQVRFYSPGRVDLPGGDPIRGPGLNGLQLCLNPPPVGDPPIITRQPVSANGIAGGCITLSVDATGPGLTYQWYKNGQPISGATMPNLTVNNLNAGSAANYIAVVSNPAGSVRSQVAVVEVLPSNQLTLGLITHLKLEDGGGDGFTAANSAPGGLSGQIHSPSIPIFVPGQIGNALGFSGTELYVVVPNYPKVSRALTVSGWVQPNQAGPLVNNWVEGQTTGSSGQFLLDLIQVNGVLTVQAQIEVGPNRVLATAGLSLEQADPFVWHHFAMTANGVTLSIYWDGQLLGSEDYLGLINSTPSIPWLSIGADLDSTQNPTGGPTLPGNADDIALWNRNLSAIEIQAIYSGGLAGRSAADNPPVLTPGECPPTIACPANIAAECTGGLTPVTFTVTATDTSGNPVPVTCVPPSGTGFRLGQSNVVCVAAVGTQMSSCSFRVTVVDTTPPTVTCSTNITANATGPSGAVVTYSASAFDACGIGTLDCAPPSGGTFPVGMTTVTCRATDSVGNSNSCSFTVTVNGAPPPVITCPPNLVAECTGGLTPVTFTVTAVDSSGAPVPVTCVPPSGTGFRLGVSNVVCTATDTGGRSSSCTFTVRVVDTTPPQVRCPSNITVQATSPAGAVVTYIAAASDACGIASFDCVPPSGSTFPCGTNTVTCRAVDGTGNANSCSFTVTVGCGNHCPTAVAKASPNCELDPNQTSTIVLSANNLDACVVLDGSMSSDADTGDTLTYLWLADLDGDGTKEPIASGAIVTNCFELGTHDIMLVVDDGHCSATASITVEVESACEAVERLIEKVDNADLDRRNKRPLIASLKAACASFDRGDCFSGVNQLNAFRNKVRAQLSRSNPDVADDLIALADKVIGCIHCE
jgi:hypothetical protein